jgi:DNA-directed RNA polymerase subunit K/omega
MPSEGHYLFVEIAAQRCSQLMHGAKPKLDIRAHKYTTVATREVAENLIPWEVRSEEEIAAEEAATRAAQAEEHAAAVRAAEASPGGPMGRGPKGR